MFYGAKNNSIAIDNTKVDYISFGRGKKNLIMIPGLGEGLRGVKGMAIPFAMLYKKYAKDFKVYVFSRKRVLPEQYNTMDMANDIANIMDKIDIDKADVVGVSEGGMIAQCLAISHPDKINKLVLVVTTPRPTEYMNVVINDWIKYADNKDYKSIFIETTEKSYREKMLKKYRKYYGILSSTVKTKDFSKFITQAKACLSHNVYNDLNKIKNKTLIIGASDDLIVGVIGSKELYENITNSELIIYDGYRHGVYDEAKDFNDKVIEFLNR